MTHLFFDTSYVVALFNEEDPYHHAAMRWAGLVKGRLRCLTTDAVLVEAGDGFAGRRAWGLFSPFLTAVLRDPLVEVIWVDEVLLDRARRFRDSRADKDWELTDCLSFLAMSDRGLEDALTADHHFVQAGFRALLLEDDGGGEVHE